MRSSKEPIAHEGKRQEFLVLCQKNNKISLYSSCMRNNKLCLGYMGFQFITHAISKGNSLKNLQVKSHKRKYKYLCMVLKKIVATKNMICKPMSKQPFWEKLCLPAAQEGKCALGGSLVGRNEACWFCCFNWLLLIDWFQCSRSFSWLASEEKEVIGNS